MMSRSSFYLKENCGSLSDKLKNLIREKDSFGCGDLSHLNPSELNDLFQNIDYSKGLTLKDLDLDGVYLPYHTDISECHFENVTNISGNIEETSLAYSKFVNCTFKDLHFNDILSFKDCRFENCSFTDCVINQNDQNLDNIFFKEKTPNSSELTIISQDFKEPLPKWYLDNLFVEIAINDKSVFSTEEQKSLNIHLNDEGEFFIKCSPDKITKDILDKIFNVLDDSSFCPAFNGIDFSNYSIPSIDFYRASFVGCNLENAFFENDPKLDFVDFRYAKINDCTFGFNAPSNLEFWKSNNLIETKPTMTAATAKGKKMNNSSTVFSAEQLKSIQNYTAAAPAVANLCRKAVKRLLRFLLTKAGKTKSMITSYVNVAMDLLENFKEEANLLFQLIIGYVCANLHKVGEYMNIDEKGFLKFFSSKKVQSFGEFCIANGKGSAISSLLKKITDLGEMFAGQLFANSDFQRIASVIENPETATRISESSEDDSETEAEIEAAPAKKTRKH